MILSAKCSESKNDCVANVEYAVRTTAGSPLAKHLTNATVELVVSGRKGIQSSSEKTHDPIDARPLVLIDVGPPPVERHGPVNSATNPLPPRVKAWVQKVAAKQPNWEYRFIAGDERICKISEKPISDEAFARDLSTDPDSAWKNIGNLPYERMDEMVTLFQDEPRILVVVADSPPIWLPRESAEWITYGNLDISERRTGGHDQQARVARRDVDADELDFFVEDGFVLLAIPPEKKNPTPPEKWAPDPAESLTARSKKPHDLNPASGKVTPQRADTQMGEGKGSATEQRTAIRAALQNGVRELTKANPALLDPDTFLERFNDIHIVEYRGTASVVLPEFTRPPSGAYHASIHFKKGATTIASTGESRIVEQAQPNWARQTLRYVLLITILVGALVVFSLGYIARRHGTNFESDVPEIARNTLFATATIFAGLAVAVAGDATSSLQQKVAVAAMTVAAVHMSAAVWFWRLAVKRRGK